ncbi:MAG: M23 family metallopeptidase [Elusimicrobiota bacterium]
MNPLMAAGNAVLIEHRPDEISVLAHFKQGSIRVKPGQRVVRCEILGLCGNSGNSSEPHLHYHLQNTHFPQEATGIRAFFESVRVERAGVRVSTRDYSPVKDDLIEPE